MVAISRKCEMSRTGLILVVLLYFCCQVKASDGAAAKDDLDVKNCSDGDIIHIEETKPSG